MQWILRAGIVFCFVTVSFAQPSEFNYNYSPFSATVLGQASIEGTPASTSDWIAAFDPDGVCSGSSKIFQADNRSKFNLKIYGDDPSTENVDEGLLQEDYFTFSFFDHGTNAVIHDTTKYFGWENRNGGWLSLNQNDTLLTLINNVKLNQLQIIGSHNSYHIAPYDTLLGIINVFAPELALSIDYTHLVLAQQFLSYGIRQIELDVYRDPEGGLFASRMGNWFAGQDVTPDIPELNEPGLKVLHFPDIDFDTHLITFKNGLEKLKIWSDIFPGHVPIFVLIECKSDGLEDYFDDYPQLENLISLLPDSITYTVPLPFDLTGLEETEAEIRDVFGESLENIITPDMVRGDFPTLEDAILNGGWPTLGEVRGKIMFGLDNQGSLMNDYMEGYPSLSGRILFTEAPPGTPEAAFLGINTPSPNITDRVNQGYLVRTRADTDTEQARTGDTSRRDEALASGAHFVSTDYYRPDPRHEFDPGWTDYSVRLPGEFLARVNPINGPPELSGNELDLINFDMNIDFILEEPVCDEGFVEIGDDCYWEEDIGVLQQFIDNSAETINMSMDENGNGVIEPLELGYIQQWNDGRLVELDCGYPLFCGLSGEIPEDIGNMVFLESVRIYVNYLSGPIPESIGDLENLSVLDLNNNLLSGPIPESICDIQPNLDVLSLDFNHLCPPYPDCIEEDVEFQDISQCVSTWYVSTSGSDSNNGSEEFPFATIQHGIYVSSDEDSVLVSSGTYFENIDYSGKNIAIIGEERESTIIDGNQSGSVVTFDSIVGSTAVLSGFTITGGNAYDGGGIYCTSSAPTIRNNIITGNISETYGGGISCNYSSAVIMDNTVTSNSAYYGGGISFDRYTSSVIKGNNISGNSAVQGGGISCTTFSSPSIINNTIYGNSAFTNGGGIYCYYVSSAIVSNTVIWDNTANTDPNISVYSADPLFNYCDVEGGWEGIGNINSDPLFVDPDSADYHLQSNSPCIDSGDPDSPYDPDGTIADMGAYYYHQELQPDIDVSPTEFSVQLWQGESTTQTLTISNTGGEPLEVELSTGVMVTDIDGNVYETVQIGGQLWMKENLKVTHYRNGDEIPTGYSNNEWANLSTGAYAVYNDDSSNAEIYGNLYNWYAIDLETGVCPENWHVPTDDEWTILSDYLGGSNVAGGKMKECTEGSCPESEYWNSPNTGATNESGFTGLPGGYRFYITGEYYFMGSSGDFWSSTEGNNNGAWHRRLDYNFSEFYRYDRSKNYGLSVRCLRDLDYLTNRDDNLRDEWLTLSEDSLTIPPDSSYHIDVTFDAANLELGEYLADIFISSNDPDEPEIIVPVNLVVGLEEPPFWSITVDYQSGWNLVGLPLEVEDSNYLTIFPDAIENTLFSFDDAYMIDTTLIQGEGYWIRFDSSGTTNIIGHPINELTISLSEGWNLVSGIHFDLSIYSISDPDSTIVPNTLFGFSDSYFSTEELVPGKGYWLRAFQDGEITLTSDVTARIIQQDFSLNGRANTLSINGSELYFGAELSERDRLSYSLPPKPPAPSIDIRFSGDTRRCSSDECVIEVMNDGSPLTFDCNIKDGEVWELVPVIGSEIQWSEAIALTGQKQITLVARSDQLVLRKSISNVPNIYALHPAFPNPFNPITTLRYDLPSGALVTLSIYDMLGKEITQLVNTIQGAGFKSVQWDATDSFGQSVSAGVYLYRIQTGEFVQTKKMVLLK